jgi:hypothetical protein
MIDGDRLAQAVRESQVPPPPDGLAARVTAEILATTASAPPPRWSWRVGLRGLGLVALGAALAALYFGRARLVPVADGARVAAARETVALGHRAVVVLETGADVHWRAGVAGGLNVVQARGTAFYRVDAGPLSVETPSGTVMVKGTCFRVEVEEMKQTAKPAPGASGGVWKGAVAGAALATVTLVTVYEGRVSLAGRQGGALQLEAGESARLSPAAAPERLARNESDNQEVVRLAQATATLRSLPRLTPAPAPPASAKAERGRLSLEDLPPAISAVVQQVAQGRQVQNFKAKREEYQGQPTFNVDFDLDGTNHELEVDHSGRVVHAEIDLDPSDLPPAVSAIVTSRYPRAPFIDAELNQKPGEPRYYEIHIRLDGQVHELNVTEDAATVTERSNCPHSGR